MRAHLPASDAQIAELAAAVQANCDIVDARYARESGLCTYLLGMREYFRWSAGLELGAKVDPPAVGAWISEREQAWESLLDADSPELRRLPVGGQIDSFDDDLVNHHIARMGLVYGAGIGRFDVPVFFLARRNACFEREGVRVTVAGAELARGYVATPAVSRGSNIVVRLDAFRRWLWTRAETALTREPGDPFRLSMAFYDRGDPVDRVVDRMARGEVESLILHELGELRAGAMLGPDWEQMLADLGDRRTEIVVRAVRDLLADCLVTLPVLLQRDAQASLCFWRSNFDGMRRALAPRLLSLRGGDAARGNPEKIADAVDDLAKHWADVSHGLLAAWRNGGRAAVIDLAETLHPN